MYSYYGFCSLYRNILKYILKLDFGLWFVAAGLVIGQRLMGFSF